MDTDKLKNKIREALGAAGVGREIGQQIERIIDKEVGDEKVEARQSVKAARVNLADDDDEDDDDDTSHRMATAAAARTATHKIKIAPRKRK
jgi:hypothetical protein